MQNRYQNLVLKILRILQVKMDIYIKIIMAYLYVVTIEHIYQMMIMVEAILLGVMTVTACI